MIRAIVYHKSRKICGFEITGHAGYADHGKDIVCAAVSALALNTVNAIETLTQIPYRCEAEEEKGGLLRILLPTEALTDHDTQLLLTTLEMGLSAIENEYKKYLTLIHKEV